MTRNLSPVSVMAPLLQITEVVRELCLLAWWVLILRAWVSKLPSTYFCIHLVPLFSHLLASKAGHCTAEHISHSGPLPCCVCTHTSRGPVREKRVQTNRYRTGGVPSSLMTRWDFCTIPTQLPGSLRKPTEPRAKMCSSLFSELLMM